MTNINHALDYFIPSSMQVDKNHLRKVRMFTLMNIILALYSIIVFSFLHSMGMSSLANNILITGLITGIIPLLLKWKIQYTLLAHLTGVLAFINFCVNTWTGGGFDCPIIIWFSVFPMLTLMLQNLKNAIPWLIITIAVYVFFYYIRKTRGELPAMVPSDIVYEMNLFLYIGFTAIVFLIVNVFDHTQNILLKQIEAEKNKSESLLLNILPKEIADELKASGISNAKLYDKVTVMFTDFKDFTLFGEQYTPQALVDELNHCFSAFDNIITKYDIEKIKTIGDAYFAASGLPSENEDHAYYLVSAALEIRDFMLKRREIMGEKTFQIRIGIHTGPVVAGIVGIKKFEYDIWGDTVNTASRMESSGQVGKINISQNTYEIIKNRFNCTHRGKISAKNKGDIDMYFVEEKL